MDANEFMKLHADNAVAGKMPEVLKDLTPESMGQVGALMAGAAQPFTANKIEAKGQDGDKHFFTVTYTDSAGKDFSMYETVTQVDGTWKIVALEKPA
jgi:hypothetical protein